MITTTAILLAMMSATENEIVRAVAPELFGRDIDIEVTMRDGTRADIITKTPAIECDYAPKWAEAIGQSLHYAEMSQRKPGVLILLKNDSEWPHLVRVAILCGKFGIDLWVVEVDESEL